jgi:hypothetical protein
VPPRLLAIRTLTGGRDVRCRHIASNCGGAAIRLELEVERTFRRFSICRCMDGAYDDDCTGSKSHHVIAQHRLAAPDPLQVFQQQVDDVVLVAAGLAGGMRRDQHIVERPQR